MEFVVPSILRGQNDGLIDFEDLSDQHLSSVVIKHQSPIINHPSSPFVLQLAALKYFPPSCQVVYSREYSGKLPLNCPRSKKERLGFNLSYHPNIIIVAFSFFP